MKKDQTFIRALKGWISGDAGLQQERELRQLAQDDPFIADALDGYQSTAGEDHDQRLQKLRKKLAVKEEKKRGLPIFLRIAAGGAILIAALFALRLVNSSESNQIGQSNPATESIEESAPSIAAEQDASTAAGLQNEPDQTETAAVTANEQAEAAEVVRSPKEGKHKSSPSSPKPRLSKKKKTKVVEDQGLSKPIIAADIAEEEEVLEDRAVVAIEEEKPSAKEAEPARVRSRSTAVTPPPTRPGVIAETRESKAEEIADSFTPTLPASPSQANVQARLISGVVMDSSGEPLVGAQVVVPNSSIGTLTDFDGKYSLSLDRNAQELQFSSLGFQSTKVPIPNIDTYNIQLSSSALVLNEVVVADYGDERAKKRQKDSRAKALTIKASSILGLNAPGVSPKGGVKQLNRTIRRNASKLDIHYSQAGQSVSVTFNVDPGNVVSKVKIVESKGLLLDQEAIRLVRLTKWELEPAYRDTGTTVYCKIQF
ncbi:MAG: carboxypeptidase-like regulatory domain-containing protein [Saprospiraceae bacterium]|nr:carboxypeptidase-like regulatory domain-containing protein [Saprospiraceae bacterium]